MRELRRYIDAALEERRHGPLLVQRVRPLSQDERDEQTADQALETAGKFLVHARSTLVRAIQRRYVARSACGTDVGISDSDQTAGTLLHKLRNPHDHPLEAQQRGRARLQRLRSLLQAPRRQQTAGHAERRHSNQEAKAEEDARVERQAIHGGARRRHRFHRFLSVHR